jgi:hypothetical protein
MMVFKSKNINKEEGSNGFHYRNPSIHHLLRAMPMVSFHKSENPPLIEV